jgi:hypothetical protein
VERNVVTTADAGRLAVHVRGKGTRAVVVLHGLGADHRQPLGLLGSPEPAWRVLAPDLRAHGATTLPESAADLTIARLAGDVAPPLSGDGEPVTLVASRSAPPSRSTCWRHLPSVSARSSSCGRRGSGRRPRRTSTSSR